MALGFGGYALFFSNIAELGWIYMYSAAAAATASALARGAREPLAAAAESTRAC